jgi:hypothetical protein
MAEQTRLPPELKSQALSPSGSRSEAWQSVLAGVLASDHPAVLDQCERTQFLTLDKVAPRLSNLSSTRNGCQRITAQHHERNESPDYPLRVGVGTMSARPMTEKGRLQRKWPRS